jgi:NAD(P)H-dependent FMN reductase
MVHDAREGARRKYQQETTKAWSAIVGVSDAFAFVTAEYNFNDKAATVVLDELLRWTEALKPLRQ